MEVGEEVRVGLAAAKNILYCYALRLIGWNNVSFTDTFSGDFQEIGELKCDGVFWDHQGYGFLRRISQRVRSAWKADAFAWRIIGALLCKALTKLVSCLKQTRLGVKFDVK